MSSNRRCFVALSFVSVCLLSFAHNASGQDNPDIFPFPVTTFELDNGLKVVGVDYDSPGIVAYYTIVRTGSRNEVEEGFSGYAHFFEHMMFRGTEKYPSSAYNAVVKRIGADYVSMLRACFIGLKANPCPAQVPEIPQAK